MSEALGIVYVDEEWEHGLRCADCNRLMQPGDCYSERLDSFMYETPLVVIACVGCAVSNQDTRGEGRAE